MKDYPWVRVRFLISIRYPATPMKKTPFPWWIGGSTTQMDCKEYAEVDALMYCSVENEREELRQLVNIITAYWGNVFHTGTVHVKARYDIPVFTPQHPKPDWFEIPENAAEAEAAYTVTFEDMPTGLPPGQSRMGAPRKPTQHSLAVARKPEPVLVRAGSLVVRRT